MSTSSTLPDADTPLAQLYGAAMEIGLELSDGRCDFGEDVGAALWRQSGVNGTATVVGINSEFSDDKRADMLAYCVALTALIDDGLLDPEPYLHTDVFPEGLLFVGARYLAQCGPVGAVADEIAKAVGRPGRPYFELFDAGTIPA